MTQLINNAKAAGEYRNITINDVSQLIVELSALSVVKSADKHIWLEDDLGYTVTITNIDRVEDGEAVTGVIFTDIIEPKIAVLNTESVEVNEISKELGVDFDYDPETGLFTIDTIGDIAPGETVKITFRVDKAQ